MTDRRVHLHYRGRITVITVYVLTIFFTVNAINVLHVVENEVLVDGKYNNSEINTHVHVANKSSNEYKIILQFHQ